MNEGRVLCRSSEENEIAGHAQKRIKRKEALERKKIVDELIRVAYSKKDHLSSLPSFHRYCTNGLSVYLESGTGDKLSSFLKQYIQQLLKVNMEGPFGSEWPTEEKVKRREMVAWEARYIFVYRDPNSAGNKMSAFEERRNSIMRSSIVGFIHYRFVVEEEVPVLYLYELQLDARVQGKGLGKFLMQLIEAIAKQNGVSAVVLTVQKANLSAMKFYMTKLGYNISAMSPSRLHLTGFETNYEILCKVFDNKAKSALE